MEDHAILALYFARDERALDETAKKYGDGCYAVSYQILRSHQDAEECVSDTYIRAWNAIPPKKPTFLGAYLMKIVRNLSLSAYQAARAKKRGDGQVEFLAEVHLEEEWACFCRPDGTAVRTVQFQGGEMRILSSRTVAVYVWQGEASSWLVDLESGEEIHWTDHDYLDPQRISDYEEAVILSATYEDDDGTYHTDILSETGEVLIADVNDARGVNHLGDGVFVAYRDGKRVLMRVDGTILYESDAPA